MHHGSARVSGRFGILNDHPEALRWVASSEPVAMILLAKSYVRPDGQVWHPFAVVDEGRVVGVLGVAVDAHNVQTVWLHHVLIDRDEQAHGYGREALAAAFEWLRAEFPHLRQVGLCVLPDNIVAWNLYASFGFEEIAVTTDGQRILLAAPPS